MKSLFLSAFFFLTCSALVVADASTPGLVLLFCTKQDQVDQEEKQGKSKEDLKLHKGLETQTVQLSPDETVTVERK